MRKGETEFFYGLEVTAVLFSEGFVLRFDLMVVMVVGVADKTDLRRMKGRMGALGISVSFVFVSAVSAKTTRTKRSVCFGASEGIEEAMV